MEVAAADVESAKANGEKFWLFLLIKCSKTKGLVPTFKKSHIYTFTH